MAKKFNHVVSSLSGWYVRKSGAERASRIFKQKKKLLSLAVN